jgi:Ni,Fe-hydrogenase I cytochrome b subunit
MTNNTLIAIIMVCVLVFNGFIFYVSNELEKGQVKEIYESAWRQGVNRGVQSCTDSIDIDKSLKEDIGAYPNFKIN